MPSSFGFPQGDGFLLEDNTMRKMFTAAYTAAAAFGMFAVNASAAASVSPDTGNTGVSGYLVPAVLAAAAIILKKKKR